jgi:enoyl-CoA hydratase
MTDEPEILIEDRGAVRWLWLNNPGRRNAQGVSMLRAIGEAARAADADDDVRVLVIAGKGPSFSSGHNLNEAVDNPEYRERAETLEGRMKQEQEVFVDPVAAIRDVRIPTVCRVQGHCIAAALMLVTVCDLVVAAEDAQFASNVTRDLGAADVEMPALSWELGTRRAKQAIWCGEGLDGRTAVAAGLANWAVPLDELDAKVDEVTDALLRVPPEALALTKMSMRFQEDRAGRADVFAYHFAVHQLSHNTSEAIAIRDARIAKLEARLAAQGG